MKKETLFIIVALIVGIIIGAVVAWKCGGSCCGSDKSCDESTDRGLNKFTWSEIPKAVAKDYIGKFTSTLQPYKYYTVTIDQALAMKQIYDQNKSGKNIEGFRIYFGKKAISSKDTLMVVTGLLKDSIVGPFYQTDHKFQSYSIVRGGPCPWVCD
jgi:hypothetical protein